MKKSTACTSGWEVALSSCESVRNLDVIRTADVSTSSGGVERFARAAMNWASVTTSWLGVVASRRSVATLDSSWVNPDVLVAAAVR